MSLAGRAEARTGTRRLPRSEPFRLRASVEDHASSPTSAARRRSGPIATRLSWSTGWPIASHIFRTCRFRPSRIVIAEALRRGRVARHLGGRRCRWPSIVTPFASRRTSCSSGTPSTLCFVHARHAVARMREPRRQVAVVGQDQQALGVEVEPADGVDVLAHARQQIDHRRPLLRIRSRRHVAARLVEQHVAMALGNLDAAAVDADVVVRRIGLRAQLAIVLPLTVTRPSSISCSLARREAMPACDRIFCRRSMAIAAIC